MGSQPVGIIWNIISRSGKYISSIQPIHEESSSGAEPLYFNFFYICIVLLAVPFTIYHLPESI